jgi:ABC-type nickel/cobalt efflux system permease component RcnA
MGNVSVSHYTRFNALPDRLELTYALDLAEIPTSEFEDTNFPERAGWKEIVTAASGSARVEGASHGPEDRRRALTQYPAGEIAAPPQDLTASFRWTPSMVTAPAVNTSSAPASAQEPSGANVLRGDYLSRMLGGREITLWMLVVGLCVAFGLGAVHALSPGHGKTIVAAYLVGSRGTVKHALLLGGLVTFTHTASVFALGLAVLVFEAQVVPEKVFPVLGAISGLCIVAVGLSLLYRRALALRGGDAGHRDHHHHNHDHEHHHRHDHDHHDHHHELAQHHDHEHGHSHVPDGPITLSSLIALGVSGGLVPCPSALVLLLSSIAMGRVALGLGLLIAFSLGLAVVLMGIGVIVLYAKHLIPERAVLTTPVFRYVPVFSAAVVTVLGLLMTGVALGWIRTGQLVG